MITQAASLAKKKKTQKLSDFLLLFPGSKAIMLGFQASSSQNSCVTDRPNAKQKKNKNGRGWGEGMAQDSEDQLSVDINFSSTEIKK